MFTIVPCSRVEGTSATGYPKGKQYTILGELEQFYEISQDDEDELPQQIGKQRLFVLYSAASL